MLNIPDSDAIRKLPPDGGAAYNRLIHEASPYLLQHASNPVDWYPWGPEALARARALDRPLFLSVGYSACHWCHVMERESFVDPGVAAFINEHFVAVKVDREERPDLDELYMTATQLLTGSGGWPNSVFLTPELKPFYAGTYFPPDDPSRTENRMGRPGFLSMLRQLQSAFQTRRADVDRQAQQVAAAMEESAGARSIATGEATLDRGLVRAALDDLLRSLDRAHGGFGSAPKFPPHSALALLSYEYRVSGHTADLDAMTRTLDGMVMGGIHDHVGGGFARYSTDDEWLLPHFEKMLYDNAQILPVLAQAWQATEREEYRRAALRLAAWVLREMRQEGGAFASALDADSEGVAPAPSMAPATLPTSGRSEEGIFYLWSRAAILKILGIAEGGLVCRVFQVTEQGNYLDPFEGRREEANILHLGDSLENLARAQGVTLASLLERIDVSLDRLRVHRDERPWPMKDTKILTSWNGLMIAGLARAGSILARPDFVDAARVAADWVWTTLRRDGRLHAVAGGMGGVSQDAIRINACLDDYAFLAHGFLELYAAAKRPVDLERAVELARELRARFRDPDGALYYTAEDHEVLLYRWKDPFDKAQPSGNAVAALVFVQLAATTGDHAWLDDADRIFQYFSGLMTRASRGMMSMVHALAVRQDLFPSVPLPPSPDQPVRIVFDAEPVRETATATGVERTVGVSVVLAIREGWHIYSHDPTESWQTATCVVLEQAPGVRIRTVEYPKGEQESGERGGATLSLYRGRITIRLALQLAADLKPGRLELKLIVHTQACNGRLCQDMRRHPCALTVVVPG